MSGPATPSAFTAATEHPDVRPWLRALDALSSAAGGKSRGGARAVGGKAIHLARLREAGYPVPDGCVLETRAFSAHIAAVLPKSHDVASIVKIGHTIAGTDRAARARDRLLAEPLPEALRRAIERLWEHIGPTAPFGLAVRSSASAEDGHELSLAGLAESELARRGPEAICDAIRSVWASVYLPRTIAYLSRAAAGGDVRLPREIAMGVLLQRMIPAEAAGVMFTAPPAGLESESWRLDERLITATLGLGTPVVDGSARTDAVRLHRNGQLVAQVIAAKRRALVLFEDGVREVAVDAARATEPALSPATLLELVRVADHIERGLGLADASPPLRAPFGPHLRGFDVEFAVEPGPSGPALWLLQVRPATGAAFPEGGDEDTVWSRANVGEALPGPATPLTWSVAGGFADQGFREAFATLGCSIDKDARLFANIDGRFYLNLTAFMQIAAQVPYLTPRSLLGASGGASEAAIQLLERQVEGVSRRGFAMRLPFRAPALLRQQLGLGREIQAFEARAEALRSRFTDFDLGLLPDDALCLTLTDAARFLEDAGTRMLAAASSSLGAHLALTKTLETLEPSLGKERADAIAQTLTGGVRELDSAAPGIAIAALAESFRADAGAREALLIGELTEIPVLPDGPAKRALASFLASFGDRAVREAELAQPRWEEDPRPVLAMVRSTLRGPPQDPARALERARVAADRELGQLEERLGPVRVAVVRVLVERAQRSARLRERMRTWVTRVLGLVRKIALDVDRRLRRIDRSLAPGSVFFCTMEELLLALRSGRAELGHVVRLRRAQHARDRARPDPPVVFVGRPPRAQLPPASGPRLRGLGASGGIVEGRARVLEARSGEGRAALDDDRLEPGEVLVARTTDIGLTPLFLIAAGVVTELGGPLSHAAIVAREYGVPAVVSVPGATTAIRTGDRVRVDGDRGLVEKLDS